MAGNAWKWVVGCGAGCAVVAVVVAIGLGVGAWKVKDMVQDVVHEAERGEQTEAAVRERFGSARDFSPPPGGAIPPERIEAFLNVREIMAPDRDELSSSLRLLGPDDSGEGMERRGGALDKMRAGMGLVPQIVGFVSGRNEALLEGGMGPGEYLYIYVLAYYADLGKSPADGPPFTLVGDDPDHNGGFRTQFRSDDEEKIRERRAERVRTKVNRLMLRLLRNQLAALEDSQPAADLDEWRQSLADEIAAVEADPQRIAWENGLPQVVAASLQPFRPALEASYDPTCNVLEIEWDGH